MKILLLQLLFVSISIASTWQPLNLNDNKNSILSSQTNNNIINLNFSIDGFYMNLIELNGEEMYMPTLHDGASILKAGAPNLQKYARSIIIPNDLEMGFVIKSSSYKEYQNINVVPSKGNLNRAIDPSSVEFSFGPEYNNNSFYPGNIIDLEDPYILRDLRGQSVVFYPLQYNPITKILRVYENIEVEIYPLGPGKINTLSEDRAVNNIISNEYKNIYQNHFVNYSENNRFDYLTDHGNMLIISYGSFIETMMPLVEWKNKKGIFTEIVNVSDIGTSSASISSYVEDYYNSIGLTFLLLVGDIAQIPSPSVSGSASDPSYGFINGNDSYAEVIVGRLSGSTPSQIATQVERSIDYERYPEYGASWYDNALGVASNQGPGFGGYSDDDFNDFLWNTILSDFTYDSYQGIYDGSGGTASQGISAINNGVSIINYTGHGSISSWGNGAPLSTSNVNSLTNNNMLPFVITVGCNVGEFNSTNECYAEAWLRATNNGVPTGAISHFGSTISQSWEPPMHGQYAMNLILTESYNDQLTRTMGGITTNGCMYMNDAQGSSGINETNYWTYFGDPSVPVRTAPPVELSVQYDDVIILGSSDFVVSTGTEGDLVALSKDGVLLTSAYTDRFGTATLVLGDASQIPGELDLVVTGFNYYPHESTVMVLSPEGAYVLVENSLVTSGFDDIIEYGETVELSMILTNVGSDPADNLSISISSDDQYITITNSFVSSFNSVQPDGTLLVEGLEFDVSGDVPNNHNFEINCTMSDNLDNIWTSSVSFTAFAPEINIESISGDLEPGMSNDISIVLSNVGGAQITYPFVVVQSDPLISINEQSFSNAYSLEIGMEAILDINVSVSPNTPIGYIAEFDVAIVANLGDGPITNTSFSIPVGQITSNFEQGLGSLDWEFSCNGLGCLNWDLDNSQSNSGSGSIKSGSIGDSQTSDLFVTLDVTADGFIEFNYKVSSEYSSSGNYFYDGLEFYIDGNLVGQYQPTTSGSSPWTNVIYPVNEGEHTFLWSYKKDGGGGSTDCTSTDCLDAAWIDDIVFPPAYIESDIILGDLNMDGIINILDVITIINIILGLEQGNDLADLNSDGSINIQDIVLVINLILGPRTDNATEASLYDNGREVKIKSDGYVGAVRLVVSHDNHFSYDLNMNSFLPVAYTDDGKTTFIIVVPEDDILFSYQGDLAIILAEAVNSSDFISIELPRKTSLYSAYPNPFNPVTNIQYSLSEASNINLAIYNLSGQLVEVLESGLKQMGSYSISWEASNQSSGVYFVKLETEGLSYVEKLMLIK